MAAFITIGDRMVGKGHPVYIVAEMSANHNHDLDTALRIVEAAAESGADAIKLQTYTPDTITIQCDKEPFQIKGTILIKLKGRYGWRYGWWHDGWRYGRWHDGWYGRRRDDGRRYGYGHGWHV